MRSRKIPWRLLLAGVALFLALGIAAPFLSADSFGNRIREALEASLGRPVKIGKVRFDLFQGPGFTISDVEIGEDPAFGIEPFVAWPGGVESLDARLKLKSLWTGKLEWSSLRLNSPVVNLVKVGTGWNFEPLLTPKLVAALPKIEVRDGRINFKFGDTESIFYIANVELDAVAPSGGEGDWYVQFRGEPARTDGPSHGYSRQSLTGRGHWRPDRVNFDLQVERSALSEVSTLIFGRDAGIHGTIASRIQLTGPSNNIRVAGRLQIQDLHRWDQMPMQGDGWPLDFHGRLDITTQRLELESQSDLLPIALRYRVADYLSQPHWALGLSWNRFPAEPLVAIARQMGMPLPVGLKLSGALDGAVSWSGQGNLQGQIALHDGAIGFPDSPAVEFEEARVLFDGDRIHLESALARTENSEARLEGDYRWPTQELDLRISSDSMTIAAIRTQSARLPAPLLEALSAGVWKGSLRYRRPQQSRESDGVVSEGWSGQIQLNQAEIALPGLAVPLRVRSASARLDGAKLWVDKMIAHVGTVDVQGDYHYEPGAVRPHRFRLAIPEVDAAELERLLMPTLRRDQGFFARTLGIGKAEVPAWMATRFMDGTVQIGKLTVGERELNQVRARVRWSGTRVDLLGVEAQVENGHAYGRVSADLTGRAPAYRIDFHLDGLDFEGGKIDADGAIGTSGTGSELLSRLHSEGAFTGRGLDIGKAASGCYRLDGARLRLTDLQLQVGPDLFIGRGVMQDDGRLLLQLSSGLKQLRVTGPLAQLAVE
jgi:hypothetical protein